MNRRAFTASLAAGGLAAPWIARAQPARRVYRIGVLGFSPATAAMVGPRPRHRFVEALLRGLRELGYVHGEHFVTEPRGAEGKAERYPELVAELIGLKVDVIVAVAASLSALKQAASTIPIVMAGHPDPQALGYVQSLGHPGGRFTGLSLQSVELTGKRLELLKEVFPTAAPVAVVWDRSSRSTWEAADAAARERGWKLLSLEIQDAGEIEATFKAATGARASALLASAGRLLEPNFRRVVEIAARSRLPALYEFGFFVEAGGLMSYGADLVDVWRRSAVFVDKILRGARPADLPIEQPSKFDLVVNLKTARTLGLTIPSSFVLRAEQVIK
jgi:putative ABC transport system substrate-binding protein